MESAESRMPGSSGPGGSPCSRGCLSRWFSTRLTSARRQWCSIQTNAAAILGPAAPFSKSCEGRPGFRGSGNPCWFRWISMSSCSPTAASKVPASWEWTSVKTESPRSLWDMSSARACAERSPSDTANSASSWIGCFPTAASRVRIGYGERAIAVCDPPTTSLSSSSDEFSDKSSSEPSELATNESWCRSESRALARASLN